MRTLALLLLLTVGGCTQPHHGWHGHAHRHDRPTGDTGHAASRTERRTLRDGPILFSRPAPVRRGGARR